MADFNNTSNNSSPESIPDRSHDQDNLSFAVEEYDFSDTSMEVQVQERHEEDSGELAGGSCSYQVCQDIEAEVTGFVEESESMIQGMATNDNDSISRFGSSVSNPHPLLVPNVVQDIFKCLQLSEVMNCRAVCHVWNAEACRILQKRIVITLVDNTSIEKYLKHFSRNRDATNFQRLEHITYQFYKLDFSEANSILQRFFTTHGGHIHSLILQQSHPLIEKQLYWTLENCLPNLESLWLRYVPFTPKKSKDKKVALVGDYSFPKIKHFTIGTNSFILRDGGAALAAANDDGGGGDHFHEVPRPIIADGEVQASLARLLSSFPNLQTFTCSTLDHSCDNMVSTNIIKALVQVPPPICQNLVQLNFPLHITQSLLLGLNNLNVASLAELNVTLDKDVEATSVRVLLASISRNLRKLNLALPQDFAYTNRIRIPGHEMRKLKELTLNRYRWSLEFLENTSGLETLNCMDVPLGSVFPIHFNYEHNLRVLKIQGSDYLVNDSEVLSRMTRAFPTLEVLHVPGVNDECLRVIYTDLPFLVELACIDGAFTDCGISGVSLEVCNDLAETMTYLIVNPDKFRRDLFIGNLTNLKMLRLESQQMSHLSVLFGIVKCPRVENLFLKSEKLCDAAVESIADQMLGSLKLLNVINCSNVTEAGKFFARERVPNLKMYISGDVVEDTELASQIKAQNLHTHFDAFSRRRARERDRPESPRDYYRRRLAYRLARRGLIAQGAGEAALAALPPPPHWDPRWDREELIAIVAENQNVAGPGPHFVEEFMGGGGDAMEIYMAALGHENLPLQDILLDSDSDSEEEEGEELIP